MRRLVALAVVACAIHAAGALVAAPRGFLALFPRRTGCSAGLGAGSAGLRAQAEGAARRRVVVVGGGVGGLAVAGLLARARPDWQLTVLEKNPRVGGRVDELARQGFRFDTGPTLLLAKDIYEETFLALGSALQDHVELRRVDPAYLCVLSDNTNVTLTADLGRMREQLERIEPGSFHNYLAYMREACINYVRGFGSRPFQSKDNALSDYANLDNVWLLRDFDASNLLMTHLDRLRRFFRSPRLHELFSFQDLYIGLAPHTAPAIFSLLQHLEIVEGVWYPVGGFQRLIQALNGLVRRAGVEVRTAAPVAQIMLDESSRRATGVCLASGETIECDLVISNVDLPMSYAALLPTDRPPLRGRVARLAALDYSSGVVAFYWCLSRKVPELEHHTTFLSPGGQGSWDLIYAATAQVPDDPSFYVCCPGKTDPSAAPAGKESMMVLVPCGCMPQDGEGGGGDFDEVRDSARRAVLRRLRQVGVDIEALIEHEVVYTPTEWRAVGACMKHDFVSCGLQPGCSARCSLPVARGSVRVRARADTCELRAPERGAGGCVRVLRACAHRVRKTRKHTLSHTPLTRTQRYGLFKGAAFGLSHPMSQLVMFRPPNRDASLANVYFVGASTTPGNGVPLVLTGARMCAQRVLAEHQ